MVMHACHSNTVEVEAERSSSATQQGHFLLNSRFKATLSNMIPSPRKKKGTRIMRYILPGKSGESGEYIRQSHGCKRCTLRDLRLTTLSSEWLTPGVNPTEGSWVFSIEYAVLSSTHMTCKSYVHQGAGTGPEYPLSTMGLSHKSQTYPSVVAESCFHKLLRFQRLQLPAELKVPCVCLLKGAEEGLPQDQIRVLNTPHVLTGCMHETVSIT